MGQLGVDGRRGEMVLLAKKVLFGAVRPRKVYPREVTLTQQLGAAGCAAPGLFGPLLLLPLVGNKAPGQADPVRRRDGCGALRAAAAQACPRHSSGGGSHHPQRRGVPVSAKPVPVVVETLETLTRCFVLCHQLKVRRSLAVQDNE